MLIQQAGSENPLLTAVSIASLGIMVVAATVHKILASWQWTLLATIVVAGVISLAFGILMGSSVTALVATAQEMLTAVKSQGQDAQLSIALTESMLLGVSSYNIGNWFDYEFDAGAMVASWIYNQVVFKMNSTASPSKQKWLYY